MREIEKQDYPLISIVTPTYNSAKFIGETIGSAQAQTYQNWEMVIVDDCSSDDTVAIIEEYQAADDRIKLIQLDINSGPAVARNTAMDHANGRFLAFLDSDDLWLPEKLEKQLRFMLEKDVAFSFTEYSSMKEDGSETGTITKAPKYVNYQQTIKYNVIGCLTVMLDTEKIGRVRMINLRSRQDFVFWLAILKKGFRAFGIQEVLAKYRLVEQSVSRNKLKMAKQNWKVYRKIEKKPLPLSIWYFVNYLFFSIRKYIL